METTEYCVKSFQNNNIDTRTTSVTLPYLIVMGGGGGGGGVKLHISGKNPQVHLIIIREGPKNTPPPILRNLDNFPLVHFIRPPLQLGTEEYFVPVPLSLTWNRFHKLFWLLQC